MADPELAGVYRRPFAEQVAFFRRKLGKLVPTRRWDDMRREEHDHGFMVAGAMKADLLTDLAAAVDKTIAEGTGLDAFRKDFEAIVARNGWTDYTGSETRKGRAWRVSTIYMTNLRTSYAAGRQAQLVAGNFKLWVYFHGASQEPRPEHLAWDGTALPPDHPFWTTHYPPSDWGCSCYVVGTNTPAGVKRLGGDPDKALPADWQKIDPKTGAPIGIGRGWDYAPGATKKDGGVAQRVRAIAGKVGNWDNGVAKAFMADLPPRVSDELAEAYRALPSTADDARRYARRVLDPPPLDIERAAIGLPSVVAPVRTLGRVRSDQAREVAELTGADVERYDFSIGPAAIRNVARGVGGNGERAIAAEDFALLPQLLSEADEIAAAGEDAETGRQLIRLIWDRGFERWEAVFEVREGERSLALSSLKIRPG